MGGGRRSKKCFCDCCLDERDLSFGIGRRFVGGEAARDPIVAGPKAQTKRQLQTIERPAGCAIALLADSRFAAKFQVAIVRLEARIFRRRSALCASWALRTALCNASGRGERAHLARQTSIGASNRLARIEYGEQRSRKTRRRDCGAC